jgi:tRNA dimethylallyltransferase
VLLVLTGATGTGKTGLSLDVADAIRASGGAAEIVNADALQLYRGLDVGTAKLPVADRRGVPHHLFDLWDVTETASVAVYREAARSAIEAIEDRGAVPILVGGSGLYVRAALDRMDFPAQSIDVRTALYAELDELGPGVLHRRLAKLDPAAAATILPSNGRRIARALEVIEITGRPYSASLPAYESVYRTVFVGLDRDDLDARVELRVQTMMQAGLVEEVRALLPLGLRGSPTAGKALGYAQLLACMDDAGEIVGDLDLAVSETMRTTRRFVRRQRSWFRRDPRIAWLDAADPDLVARASAAIAPTLE